MKTTIAEAKTFWRSFVQLCDRQDETLVEMYCPNCLIYEDVPGYRNMVKTGPEYLPMVRSLLRVANKKGQRILDSTFRRVVFAAEGDRVSIKCIRHSNLKDFDSPFTLLVECNDDGRLWIVEERMEHRLTSPLKYVEVTVPANEGKTKKANHTSDRIAHPGRVRKRSR